MPTPSGPSGTLVSWDADDIERMQQLSAVHVDTPFRMETPLRWCGLSDSKILFPLPITKLIGVPLVFMSFDETKNFGLPLKYINHSVTPLAINCDPGSDGFCKPGERIDYTCVLIRADGHDFSTQHAETVEEYVKEEMSALFGYGATLGKATGRKDLRERAVAAVVNATPANFEAFFEANRSRKSGADESWNKVVNPLRIETRLCKSCGKEDNEQEPLLLCGSCKLVNYCSKQCQKKDWNLHKTVFH